MRRIVVCAASAAVVLCIMAPSARSAATSLPREAIEQEIKESGAVAAVARTPDDGRELLIGSDIVFHAASTMKDAGDDRAVPPR